MPRGRSGSVGSRPSGDLRGQGRVCPGPGQQLDGGGGAVRGDRGSEKLGQDCSGLRAPGQVRSGENRWVEKELQVRTARSGPGPGARRLSVWAGPGATTGRGRQRAGRQPRPSLERGEWGGHCLPVTRGRPPGHRELSAHGEPSNFLPTPFPKKLHYLKCHWLQSGALPERTADRHGAGSHGRQR